MDEEPPSIETRLWALETLVAFLYASQHMQSADPMAAITRLKRLLIDQADDQTRHLPEAARRDAVAELDRSIGRIERLQDLIPRRLVD